MCTVIIEHQNYFGAEDLGLDLVRKCPHKVFDTITVSTVMDFKVTVVVF